MLNVFLQELEKKDHFCYPDFVRFNANRCNVCAILNKVHKSVIQKSPSKGCSGCKLISYCGIEHQKLDWPMHKQFCKSVQLFLTDSKLEHPLNNHKDVINTKTDLKNRAQMLSELLQVLLGRPLKIFEFDLLYFPRICANCFTFKIISNEWNCSNECKLVTYCSIQCKKSDEYEHEKNCKNLQIATNFYEKDILLNIKLIMKKMYKLNMRNQINLIDVIEKFINIKIPKLPKNIDEYHKFYSASRFNYVMTISYILDFCNILRNLKTENKLIIYIVGEHESIINFQNDFLLFLISQIPSIKVLTMIFISEYFDDINISDNINYKGKKYDYNLCFINGELSDVINKIIVNKCMLKNVLFEQYVTIDKPDLIIYFNMGLRKQSECIKDNIYSTLSINKTPIAFTSSTLDEANKYWNMIRETAINMDITYEILMKTKENPFKDCVPKRNLYPNNEDISFTNHYLSIIKR